MQLVNARGAANTRPCRGRHGATPRAWLAAVLLGAAAPAFGHADQPNDLVVDLDQPPPQLRGVLVRLHRTLGYQLLVENRTGKRLEVLDASGRPFLRIGPDGVAADLAAAEWYRTYTAVGAPRPALPDDAAPRWTSVSRTPAWGWFDRRLRTEGLHVSAGTRARGSAVIGRWEIPVRIDGALTRLTGTFRHTPAASGYFAARLTSPEEISPGLRVRILRGARPALYLENRSAQPVTVYGANGEPFLVIGSEGVRANVLSPAWLASGQAEATTAEVQADTSAPARWQWRSSAPRFAWLEPRLAYSGKAPPETGGAQARRAEMLRWEIPIRHGDRPGRISGAIDWIPLAADAGQGRIEAASRR
ncbi:MAG: hypothetical protein ACJ8J7_10600 [Sulfurifustaceae bacterium]